MKPGPADSQIFTEENGVCIATDMKGVKNKYKESVTWKPADKRPGSRVTGLERLRTYLEAGIPKKDKDGKNLPLEEPALFIFDTCHHFLRTVPTISRDKVKLDDVNTKAEDHIYDDTRYRLTFKRTFSGEVKAKGG